MLKELKKTGAGFVETNFTISKDIVSFLEQEYNLGRDWEDGSEFLEFLQIPLKIRKAPDSIPIMIEDCEIKFGNNRSVKYFFGEESRDQKSKFF